MTITVELSDEQASALGDQAKVRGLSLAQWVAALAGQIAASQVPREATFSEPPIWETLARSMSDVPPGDLTLLPGDGASQIDHYIYGHPKTRE